MAFNTNETIASYLGRILDSVHPLMAEGLYLAAVPHWYDASLFSAMRRRDDDRDQGVIERLARYSFVIPLQEESNGATLYRIRPEERIFLQRQWIAKDPQAYQEAHRRALAYWKDHPDPNPYAQAQNRLYHQLFVDIQAGMDYLIDRFRAYHNDRQLAAIERLLDSVDEARFYLAMLKVESLHQMDDLLIHLRARLAQLRGQWSDSLDGLQKLRQKVDLAPWLMPYVARAYGYALAQTEDYVAAIEQFQFALDLFNKQSATITDAAGVQAERAHTMIALGTAHVNLATSIRGHHERISPDVRGLQRLQGFFHFFLSLPLVFYLSLFLGKRVWHPRFWPTLIGLDWIVARLFASGAKLYATADPILEAHGTTAEGLVADEQLARLYLAMGDAEQAQLLLSRLLSEENAALGDYRRAAVRVGLGDALLVLGEYQQTEEQLEKALPVLSLYQDTALYAQGEMLLALARGQSGKADEAIKHMRRALRGFQRTGDVEMVTEAAEHLEELARNPQATAGQKEAATKTAGRVTYRRYPVRYRDPATVFFQRASLGLTAVLIFLIFVSIIRLETGVVLQPIITFNASPLLRSDAPDFTPDLSQGIAALNVSAVSDPQVLLWLGALLFLAYLALSTVVGILAIVRTSLAKVQARARAEIVRFDGDSVQIGEGESRREIRLPEVTEVYRADMRFVDQLMVDDSCTTLATPDQQITIKAATAWYPVLQERIARLIPSAVKTVDASYSLLRSRMGALYLLTVVALIFLSLLGRFSGLVVVTDIPFLRYSLADLYPYVYLGLFIPPFWWFIVQPLRVRLYSDPQNKLAWGLAGAGLALALLRVATRFRPWATVPDLYSPLLILCLVLSASLFLGRAKRPDSSPLLSKSWLKAIVPIVSAILLFIMSLDLWREVGAYHYQVLGDSWRDQSLRQQGQADRSAQLKRAITRYSRAIQLSQIKVLGFDSRSSVSVPFGIPPVERFTWVRSLDNRAALSSQLGDYGTAIADFTELIEYIDAPAEIYADRAMAYLGAGTLPGEELGMVEVAEQNYDAALADFDQSIALAPANASYYLWRGVTYHGLGDVTKALSDYEQALFLEGAKALDATGQAIALIGEGWIAFVNKEYDLAADLFQQAADVDAGSVDAYLALGYADYALRQYNEALQVWEQAAANDPSNPIAFISLGTLYWRVATVGDDYDSRGIDRCSSNTLPEAAKRRSARQLEKSVEFLGRSTGIPGQDPEDVAFTFRTMGQVQFLLRNCPGVDAVETLEKAVGFYGEAISLDPDSAVYWHMRGRLSYVLWLNSPAGTGPSAREWLFQGLADQEKALELDPVDAGDYRPNAWRTTIYAEAVDGTLAQGDKRFAGGNYALAGAYYELVATNVPDHAQAAFKAGLAAAAAGDQAKAIEWYQSGVDRAMSSGDPVAVQEAQKELQAFAASQPGFDASALEAIFEESSLDLDRPLSAAIAFEWGLAALRRGEFTEAGGFYEQGLELAAEVADISEAASAMLALLSEQGASAILPDLARSLPPLETAAGNDETNVDNAFKMALIALAVGDTTTAGRWYNEGVRRSAVQDNYPPLRASRGVILSVWATTGVTSDALLAQMERQLPSQLEQYPELAEDGLYWRFRAWFKYGLGLSAFRLGEEAAARNALQSAQADAKMAFDLDSANNSYVQTYLAEGAWGWYHVERGNDAFTAADYKAAMVDYEAAVRAYAPRENSDARNEIAIAAFRAGLTALLLGEPDRAATWYKQGLALVTEYGAEEFVLAGAIDDLEAALSERGDLAETGMAILDSLKQSQ